MKMDDIPGRRPNNPRRQKRQVIKKALKKICLKEPEPSGKIEALIQALGLRNANLIAAG